MGKKKLKKLKKLAGTGHTMVGGGIVKP